MQKIKSLLKAVLVISVVLALVLPGSAVITNDHKQSISNPIMKITDYKFQKVNQASNMLPSLAGDVQAAGDAYDEHTPAICKDNIGNLWIFYVVDLDVLDSDIYMKKSTDDGKTWLEENAWYLQVDGLQTTPVASLDPSGKLWVAFVDEGLDVVMFLIAQDTSVDPLDWEWWSFEQSDNNEHKQMGGIASYPSGGIDIIAHVYICNIVYDPYSVDEAATVEHSVDGGGAWTYTWDSTWTGKPASYPSIGASKDLFFLAFQYTSDVTSKEIINCRWGDAVAQADMEQWPFEWGSFETNTAYNCQKPSIAGSGNNIVLVYQSDEQGNENIICSYSNDDGATWTHNIDVTTSGADEENPRVMISGTNVYCLYTEGGDLYMITSKDTGATWGSPEKINDVTGSVENTWHTADITTKSMIWTDNRNADLDLYCDGYTVGSAPSAPTITGQVNGKTGTAYEYTFLATDPDNDKIAEYTVNWGDQTTDTIIGPFDVGVTAKKSHTYAADGTYIIKATAKDVNGLIGPEGSLSVTMPRSRTIFVRFLDYFPHAFPILRMLLEL